MTLNIDWNVRWTIFVIDSDCEWIFANRRRLSTNFCCNLSIYFPGCTIGRRSVVQNEWSYITWRTFLNIQILWCLIILKNIHHNRLAIVFRAPLSPTSRERKRRTVIVKYWTVKSIVTSEMNKKFVWWRKSGKDWSERKRKRRWDRKKRKVDGTRNDEDNEKKMAPGLCLQINRRETCV